MSRPEQPVDANWGTPTSTPQEDFRVVAERAKRQTGYAPIDPEVQAAVLAATEHAEKQAGEPDRSEELAAELQKAMAFIESMAEARHMMHGANSDRFWGCSRLCCKSASAFLRGLKKTYCKARAAGTAGGNEGQDCDWPFCGCDPVADRVLAAIQESGLKIVKDN